MTELICLDWGEFGQVVVDPEASYVRSWSSGWADDPRWLQQLDVALDAARTHRVRYVITDISAVSGAPTVEFLEHLDVVMAALVDLGCRTHLTVIPADHRAVVVHARSAHSRQRGYGMAAVEVSSIPEALEVVAALDACRDGDSAA